MLHRNRQTGAVSAALLLIVSNIAAADTSDVRHFTPVVVEKSGDHCADDPNCFNR
jgi:formamidase